MDKQNEKANNEHDLIPLAGIIDTVSEPMVVLDSSFRVVKASSAFYSTFQLKPDEAEGSILYDLNNRQWDIPKLRELLNRIISSESSIDNYKIEHEFEHPGMRTLLLNGRCSETHLDKSPLIFLAIEDITERTQADETLEMFRFSIDEAADAIFFMNRQGEFLYVNDQACRSLGYTRDELMQLHLSDIDPVFPRDNIDEQWEQFTKDKVLGHHIETIHRRKNGVEFPVEIFSKHIWFGNVEFHVAFVRDITERKKAEEERIAHIRFLESLEHIDHATRKTVDLNQMMKDVLDALLVIFNCDRAFLLYPCDPDAEYWHVPMERTVDEYPRVHNAEIKIPIDPQFKKVIRIMLETDGPVVFGPGSDYLLSPEETKQFHVKSQLSMVVYPKSGNPWMLGLHQCSYAREWTKEEKSLFNEIGRRIADALTGLLALRDLKESEEQLRLALKAANQGLYDLTIKTGDINVSPEYATMLGYDPEFFVVTFSEWVELLHPDDHDRVLGIFNLYIRGDIPDYSVEFRLKTKTNDWLWILSVGKIVEWDADGKPLRMIGTHTDITKLKKTEESLKLFQLFVDNASEAVEWITEDGGFAYINEEAHHSLGYTKEEMMQLHVWDIDPEYPKERWPQQWEKIKKLKKLTFEAVHKKKNREIFPVEVTANHIFLGENEYHISFVHDITERKKAGAEKEKLEAQLIQAQKMESIGRLAGGVAHDFNNMLSVIIGYTEMIKLNLSEDDPLLKDITEIEKAAIHSKDITSQLITFSRKQIIIPTVLNLNELIEKTKNTLSRLIGENIQLHFIPGKDIWNIKFDRSQIEQILVNLSANSRDAMPNGGKLTIETSKIHIDEAYCMDHPEFLPGYFVILSVSDNGIGMSKETLSIVFEPFFTTKGVGEGPGLGLPTVYGIVKQNGGFINIYSEPGQGTTFSIYIPALTDEKNESSNTAEEDKKVPGAVTILLVEDDDMVRRVATSILISIGYTVLVAETPEKALELCSKDDTSFELLMTDVIMPGLSGAELRDKIKALKPEIKVLFMSGYTSDVIVHHGVLEKGVHFIHKPFTLNELSRKLREILGDT